MSVRSGLGPQAEAGGWRARDAGIVGSERKGLWAYPYVLEEALEELTAWLS